MKAEMKSEIGKLENWSITKSQNHRFVEIIMSLKSIYLLLLTYLLKIVCSKGPGDSENGFQIATRANKCLRQKIGPPLPPHGIDCVASHRFKIFFMDNVKAGSSTVRASIGNGLSSTWFRSDMPCQPSGRTVNRTKSTCFTTEQLEKEYID